jgi:hypothetical protein
VAADPPPANVVREDELPPFQILPPERRARVFGVDYAIVPQSDGGDLWISRAAWHWFDYLQPERWWDRDNLAVRGERLAGSTGTVYRALSAPPGRVPRDLVVKFSRIAQDVPLFIPDDFLESLPKEAVATARFLGPFAEFGLLTEMRESVMNHGPDRLRTKVPLAIYSPPEKYPLWQTGRHADIFRAHQRAMAADQFENGLAPVTLDLGRDYVLLFEWIDGIDAEEASKQGYLEDDALRYLTHTSNLAMARLGYRVLDNKPRHVIVRPRPDGTLATRHGRTLYAVVDFELLQRIEDEDEQATAANLLHRRRTG